MHSAMYTRHLPTWMDCIGTQLALDTPVYDGNQCSCWRRPGAMWSHRLRSMINRTAAIWTRSSGSRVTCGRPACQHWVAVIETRCYEWTSRVISRNVSQPGTFWMKTRMDSYTQDGSFQIRIVCDTPILAIEDTSAFNNNIPRWPQCSEVLQSKRTSWKYSQT